MDTTLTSVWWIWSYYQQLIGSAYWRLLMDNTDIYHRYVYQARMTMQYFPAVLFINSEKQEIY